MRYAIYTRLSKSGDDRAVSLAQQAEACQRYIDGAKGLKEAGAFAVADNLFGESGFVTPT